MKQKLQTQQKKKKKIADIFVKKTLCTNIFPKEVCIPDEPPILHTAVFMSVNISTFWVNFLSAKVAILQQCWL